MTRSAPTVGNYITNKTKEKGKKQNKTILLNIIKISFSIGNLIEKY